MSKYGMVKVWEEDVVIPTYLVGKPDKNPLFLEKRVYQGSSGKVYPHPVIDKITDIKVDKKYKALFLENDFLKIMILPELGGRVQRAYDKIKKYDFVYYNHVIKPALVGLAGPWISGGIEFNWPQHHRPSTFDPINYVYFKNSDGSASIVVSENETMFHTKAEIEFKLFPDKAYLELNNHIYNSTNIKQTFLWWANPAVRVHENYSSIFPPDVTAVMDHGKRDVSTFPIATGTYYKVDYSKGVDISKYCNLPVPTSYMAAKSNFDFVGGFDYKVNAGILHVADHHISPGKKQWTWGCGDFGKAWDRNLTDVDGPYFELMTGCFTDNQPDFSYIGPNETRNFNQYFMPYHDLGQVHNANKDLSIHVDVDSNIKLKVYCSSYIGECQVFANGQMKKANFECGKTYEFSFMNPGINFEQVEITIKKNDLILLSFNGNFEKFPIPEPSKPAPEPEECKTLEDLYLYGTHIEQYRHATRKAENYYLEGLKRDKTDIRLNNAYGLLLYKKGEVEDSINYFKEAINKETRSNPNYVNGESNYNMGIALLYMDRIDEAFDYFYKSTWSMDTKANAYYFMSVIMCIKKMYCEALSYIDSALIYNSENYNALILKCLILKALKLDYSSIISSILNKDKLNILALFLNGEDVKKHLINPNMAIDIAMNVGMCGFEEEALNFLNLIDDDFPMIDYYKGFYSNDINYLIKAMNDNPYCCFPNRIEDIKVLEHAIRNNPKDYMAYYYLGNLYFDKERHNDAIKCFEKSIELGANFPTPFRNLSLLKYNVSKNKKVALELMEKAFDLDKSDARILYELDLLKKRIGVQPSERLMYLKKYIEIVKERDDLFLEYITLLNLTNKNKEALNLILSHNFHPWEGGEGKVPEQYIYANIALRTKSNLEATFEYPKNLGEGKLYGAQENRQNYLLGCLTNDRAYFEKASKGLSVPISAVYYNDQPPETIFYQGLSLLKLNKQNEAKRRFDILIDYANLHINDEVKIDYFAVSLPDLLVFDDDLNLKNKLHCMFMKALGLYGLGKIEESRNIFSEAMKINPNNFAVVTTYHQLFEGKI